MFRALILREGLADRLADRLATDSAGTEGYHVGDGPDPRSSAAARRRGGDIAGLRARQVSGRDFAGFDLVLAMDRGHHAQLSRLCPPDVRDRLRLFLDFAPHLGIQDVPDPYYGGQDGFERVLDMIEAGCQGSGISVRWGCRCRIPRPASPGLPDRLVAFIDPAIYYADPEIELAFGTLFSDFGSTFFRRYNEIIPLRSGFFEARRDLYNLYPLLVHVRLFGGSYVGQVADVVRRFVG